MSDAPKRVWMDPTSEDEHGMFIVAKENIYGNMDVEYTRTDTVDARLDKEYLLALRAASQRVNQSRNLNEAIRLLNELISLREAQKVLSNL